MQKYIKKFEAVSLDSIPAGRAASLELECFIPLTRINELKTKYPQFQNHTAVGLAKAVLELLGVNIQVTSDGSLYSQNGHGAEFKITWDITKPHQLRNSINMLRNIFHIYVNDTAGGHIHIDCRNISDRNRECIRVQKFLPILYAMIATKRINKHRKEFRLDDRNYALRIHPNYNTVELRILEGTLDINKILTMAEVYHAIMHTSSLVSSTNTIASNLAALATVISPELMSRVIAKCRRKALKNSHVEGVPTYVPRLT